MSLKVLRWGGVIWISIACLSMLVEQVEAKKKRLNDKILKEAVALAKDREKKFSGETAMDNEAFQASWATFTEKLNGEYAGHEVKLKKFGNDVRYRNGFTHVMYMALRSQTRGVELKPPAQEVIAAHPFLQELIIEGSCYTGGDPFPKKVAELIEANPGIPFLLSEKLDLWDRKLRSKFEKAHPKAN
ncbi:MAG: hypothetical protein CME19_01750 [Gemmatimonadetes bacterium]|nr:hypothetical protein [Gemmatimonadota bacterium]